MSPSTCSDQIPGIDQPIIRGRELPKLVTVEADGMPFGVMSPCGTLLCAAVNEAVGRACLAALAAPFAERATEHYGEGEFHPAPTAAVQVAPRRRPAPRPDAGVQPRPGKRSGSPRASLSREARRLRRGRLAEAVRSGMTLAAAAALHGVSPATAHAACREHGVAPRSAG